MAPTSGAAFAPAMLQRSAEQMDGTA